VKGREKLKKWSENIYFEGKEHTHLLCRDCHGYTHGNPWAFKRAQEEPKQISNEGDMVQILF
jgi:hypothetical protein